VGEISAKACAETSQKFRALLFNFVWVFLTVDKYSEALMTDS
jgi:hypothetical protein